MDESIVADRITVLGFIRLLTTREGGCMSGKLVICPTPIGNLGDMPPRALEALRDADTVCAEDTRVTGKLLVALGVEGKHLERLDENVIGKRAEQVVQRVLDGETVAYCSDAGMPGVSDPGLRLVRTAREMGAQVEVLPGPTAVATAFVASGSTSDTFYFGGFFPRKDSARKSMLESLRSLQTTLIFYESPNRVVDALKCIADTYPYRTVAVCRELTKLHEEVVWGKSDEVWDQMRNRDTIKGEIVLVIEPAPEEELEDTANQSAESAAERASELISQGIRPKQVSKMLAEEFNLPRNEAYKIALEA